MPRNLLTIPKNAGRRIIEAGAVITCPLFWTDKFIRFCSDRGLTIDRARLIRLERLGLFAPIFRVKAPSKNRSLFHIPVKRGKNWFTRKWAWDTTDISPNYIVPDYEDRTQEGYYSIFQIDHLQLVLAAMTLHVQWDSYLDKDKETIDWQKNGERWMAIAEEHLKYPHTYEFRRSLALLCQYISNRYYPKTQGDQRTIQVSQGGIYTDQWILVNGRNWDWHNEVSRWNPHKVERMFDLTPKNLKHAYSSLAIAQASCDPIEKWYQLVQFISPHQRARLKGDALRAETLRSGAQMLRHLYKDLYDKELPHPNEVSGTARHHFPELHVRQDPRRYLEFVVNRFRLNPQPKLSLIVEGQTEEVVVLKIFEKYFGAHPGIYGIEIIVLGGVDVATGTAEDRFRAILRLIDYLHHHQTMTFIILDNENHAKKLKQEARKTKSIHSGTRYVTRSEYIQIWKKSFEFDNFSNTEITAAMNAQAKGHGYFTRHEIANCRESTSGDPLGKLYLQKTNYGLSKKKLSGILIDSMLSNTRRKLENRPIIRILEKVARMAARNSLPTMQKIWELNQASKYLGKKRKSAQGLNNKTKRGKDKGK